MKSLKRHRANKCTLSLLTFENTTAELQPKSEPHHLSNSEAGNPLIRRSSPRVTVKREITSILKHEDQDDDTAINLDEDNQYPSDKDDDYLETGEDEEDDNASDFDFSDNDYSDGNDEDYRRRQRGRKNRGDTSIKKLQCRLCPASFMAEASLKGHQLGVHESRTKNIILIQFFVIFLLSN